MGRSEDVPVDRERRPCRRNFRDAEVEDLRDDVPIGLDREEHVSRLHVAMDDPLLMHVVHRGEDRQRERDGLRCRERPALAHRFFECSATKKLHDEAERSIRLVDEIEYAHDVAMRDRRRDARLAPKALVVKRRALGCREGLDRDLGLRRLVARDPDVAHAAAADTLNEAYLAAEQLVGRDVAT
jgi:hypothetical protein